MIRPFGESALLVDDIGAEAAQQLAASQARDPIHGVVEVVPGLASVLVELEPDADAAALVPVVTQRLEHSRDPGAPGRVRRIPVVYGGDHGPDLDEVARMCDLAPDEVIRRHVATELRVLFVGFAPGFAYLGELPPELRVPRLETPRVRTPPGSVAIADAMTGIYPAALPGGWRVIGRTPITLFDPMRDPPAYLVPGDRIRFEPIGAAAFDGRRGPPEDWR